MKELDNKSFDQSYKYDDYKKQIKRVQATSRSTTTKAKLELIKKNHKRQA